MKENIKILIVDDSKVIRAIVSKFLLEIGFNNFTFAIDGSDALKIFTSSLNKGDLFNLIITGWNMPSMTGIDFVKKVRALSKNVKVIMVTAEVAGDSIQKSIVAGVDSFIAKPFTQKKLEEHILNLNLKS